MAVVILTTLKIKHYLNYITPLKLDYLIPFLFTVNKANPERKRKYMNMKIE